MRQSLSSNNVIIAGGAITSIFTGQKIRDYDLYFHCADDLRLFEHSLVARTKASPVFVTDHATTYRCEGNTFQLVKVVFGSAAEVFDKFDFTVCMGAYSCGEDTFTLQTHFIQHNSQRKLVFHKGTLFPICSMVRTVKYMRRGYTMTGVERIRIAMAVSRLQLTSWQDVKKQLQGIDTTFLKPLTDNMLSEGRADKTFDYDEFDAYIEDIMTKYYHELQRTDLAIDFDEPEL
jgi:hypothetical protein